MKRLIILVAGLALTGCSIAMSANRQSYKGDPAIIQVGADRNKIEAILGSPDMMMAMDAGRTKAIYKIDPNAVTSGTKTAEVAGNVVADVLTAGLWEIVATPVEIGSRDKLTTYIILYGGNQKIESVETVM